MKNLKLDTQLFINLIFVLMVFIILWTPLISKNLNPFATLNQLRIESQKIYDERPDKSLKSRIDITQNHWGNTFGLRDILIERNNPTYAKYNGYVRSADLLLGKNGWLFYSPGLLDTWKRPPYTPEQKDLIFNAETFTSIYFKSKNITYLKVMPPDKHEIYPELTNIPNVESLFGIRREQYAEILKIVDETVFVEIDQPLLEAKKNRQVFYKSDSHWNNYGSFIAYQEIAKEIKKAYPNIEILEESDFIITEVPREAPSDLGKHLYQSIDDITIIYKLKPAVANQKLTDNKKIDMGVFIIDSYFDSKYEWGTVSFLAKHFKSHTMIYNYNNVTTELIDSLAPNVVIHQTVERSLE